MVENDSGKISSFGEKSMINITDQKRGKVVYQRRLFSLLLYIPLISSFTET